MYLERAEIYLVAYRGFSSLGVLYLKAIATHFEPPSPEILKDTTQSPHVSQYNSILCDYCLSFLFPSFFSMNTKIAVTLY